MYPNVYYVDKTSGSIGDVLLAYGVAAWLSTLLPDREGIELHLSDRGSSFEIRLDGLEGLPTGWVTGARQPPGLMGYIYTEKTAAGCPPSVPRVDYDAERKQQSRYWEARRQLSEDERKRADEVLREQGIEPPALSLPIWMLINTQKARTSYNNLVVLWHQHGDWYPRLVDITLRLFGAFPNPVDAAVAEWQALATEAGLASDGQETAVQIVNPQLAKGGNQPKAQRLTESNIGGFWLLEYLRYAGLYQAAIPIVVQGSGDRKTYVPLPCDMAWSSTPSILEDYRGVMYASTAIKSDILSVLRYMDVYIQGWVQAQADPDALPWVISQPGDHASGIAAVFYKDMGSAHALLDMSVLTLPRWMPAPETVEEAKAYQALINEHRLVIGDLKEDRGEEIALLRRYRRFLTTGDLSVFFDFCAGLGVLVMSLLNSSDARERGRARLFSVTIIERMIDMSDQPYYSDIFHNEGFQRVAAAIRQATFLPQWNKSKGREGEYHPEYGLGQKLRQQAAYRDKFLAELAAFVQRYQAETLRRMEHPSSSANKGVPRRTVLSAEDLADIAALVDTYGSEVVCELLVAAGYSWAERRGESAEE